MFILFDASLVTSAIIYFETKQLVAAHVLVTISAENVQILVLNRGR